MLTSIVSKATSGFRSTSLEEKGMRDLLDEADSFSKAVEELRGWVMKSNASNSPNAKKFLTQSIQLLMGCYRDIFKQIQNQVNGSCSSDTSRTAPKATRDSEFRKVVRRDLERRVGTLSAIFVSDTIRIENFNPGIVLNWENILLRAVDFFYKHQFITLNSLRNFFENPKALEKLAIRTMNHSPKIEKSRTYPNYSVSPNLESMTEYWELLYSVTIIQALDQPSQTLVAYFAVVDLLKGVIEDSVEDPPSKKWIEAVTVFKDPGFLNRLLIWFKCERMKLNSDLPNRSSRACSQRLEEEVGKLIKFFQMPPQVTETKQKVLLSYQYICTFHTLDFTNSHYGSALFQKISSHGTFGDYNELMNQIKLMKAATRLKGLIENVFEYGALLSHGIFDNKEQGLKLYPKWEEFYWRNIIPVSHRFERIYGIYSKEDAKSRNVVVEIMLGNVNKRATSLEQIHDSFMAVFSEMNHQNSSSSNSF
ncbi:hypothetical protein PGTUg99_017799 [Puccinia graminis f. sp. tritici]|uniref:Uncharacterized protein n=2 Tax=Puccinia graminis f. sp. tritici TaxID=56615 RepID=A0A5B0RNX6_PUCGR|nr:hypothetical protein PGTUg99_017799 [Puccinia graminis f. sp. tritici]